MLNSKRKFGPRIRSKGVLVSPGNISETAAGPYENWTHVGSALPLCGEVTVMADVVQEKFDERRSRGEVIFNPMNVTRNSFAGEGSSLAVMHTNPGPSFGQTYTVNGNPFLFLIGQVTGGRPKGLSALPVSRCQGEASTKAQRPPNEAGILVTLAELEKTRRLVPDLLHSWSKLFSALNRDPKISRYYAEMTSARKLSASNLRVLEKTAVETWLAMRFGVRPLIMDTLNVLKVLKKQYDDTNLIRLTQRGSASASVSEVESGYVSYGVSKIEYVASHHNEVRCRAMSLWDVFFDASRDAGLSLAAVPEAAIDLVRFSFVVNWMVNVNDFFASIGALSDPGLRNKGGCLVTEIQQSSTWQATSTTSTNSFYTVTQPVMGTVSASHTSKVRAVGLSFPKLVVRASPWRFLQDLRLIDAVALTRQQLRGRNVRVLANLSAKTSTF